MYTYNNIIFMLSRRYFFFLFELDTARHPDLIKKSITFYYNNAAVETGLGRINKNV